MPKTLADPSASPTRDRAIFGDPVVGGGTVPAGLTKYAEPSSNYVWTGALWIPAAATSAGETKTYEYHSEGILQSIWNLLVEMQGTDYDVQIAGSELRKVTGLGMPVQARQTMTGTQVAVDGHPAPALATRQAALMAHGIGQVAFSAERKYVGEGGVGAYTSPAGAAALGATVSAVTFTGVNLVGRVYLVFNVTDGMYHNVVLSSVVDPAGGAVGTMNVTPAIPSANAILRIPYVDVPYGYNTAADALQTIAVAAPPKGVNGPAPLLSNAALAEVAGPYTTDVPVANYDEFSLQIYWVANAGDTYQWDILARLDDQAVGDWVNVNGTFAVSGTALGAPALNGLTLATSTDRRQYRDLRVLRTKTNNNGPASIRLWFMEGR